MKQTIVKIPNTAKVFVVDDNQGRIDWFRSKLPDCIVAMQPIEALVKLVWAHGPEHVKQFGTDRQFDIIFLDHDAVPKFLDPTDPDFLDKSFWRVAQYLHRIEYPGIVVVHSGNPVGAQRMAALLGATAQVSVLPIGSFDIEVT